MIELSIFSWELRSEEFTPERYQVLVNHALDKMEADPKTNYQDFRVYVNDLTTLPDWIIRHAKIKIIRPMQLISDGDIEARPCLEAVRLNQVHLPNNQLLSMKEVRVLEDACTDAVNLELQNGWKMIAVLPQTRQRRPDYILGRPE